MTTPTEAARALQALSARSRWAKLTPAQRSAAMKRVRASARHYRSCGVHAGGACTCADIREAAATAMFTTTHADKTQPQAPRTREGS